LLAFINKIIIYIDIKREWNRNITLPM